MPARKRGGRLLYTSWTPSWVDHLPRQEAHELQAPLAVVELAARSTGRKVFVGNPLGTCLEQVFPRRGDAHTRKFGICKYLTRSHGAGNCELAEKGRSRTFRSDPARWARRSGSTPASRACYLCATLGARVAEGDGSSARNRRATRRSRTGDLLITN